MDPRWPAPLVLLLAGLLLPESARGWGAATHRLIAWRAFRAVEGWPMAVGRAGAIVLGGAVAPDRAGPGHLASEAHIFHVQPGPDGVRRGEGPRVAARLYHRAVDPWVTDEAALYELGRLCHVIADLHQPMHTASPRRRAGGSRDHTAFEHHVDGVARRLVAPVTGRPGPRSLAGALEEAAVRAHSALSAVDDVYVYGRRHDVLEARVGRLLEEAAGLSAAAFAEALAARRRARAWGFVVWAVGLGGLLWMGLGLGPHREPRWPGLRPFGETRWPGPRPAADLPQRPW